MPAALNERVHEQAGSNKLLRILLGEHEWFRSPDQAWPARAPPELCTQTADATSCDRIFKLSVALCTGDYGWDPLGLGADPTALKWWVCSRPLQIHYAL